MVSATVRIETGGGLHLRPTGVLCNTAMKYKSSIRFRTGDVTANAKSVLSVLGACIGPGDEVTFICEGEDEEEALNGILDIIRKGLKDEENEKRELD